MGGPHPISRGLKRKSLTFPEEEETLPAADGRQTQPAASRFPGSAACRWPALRFELAHPHICVSQFLKINSSLSLYIDIYINNLLAVFLWRTLMTNLPTQGIPSLRGMLASRRNFRSAAAQTITNKASQVQILTPCGHYPKVSSPRGLQGRHQQTPPLQG